MKKSMLILMVVVSLFLVVSIDVVMSEVFVKLKSNSGDLLVDGNLNVTGKIIGVESEKSWAFDSPAGSSGVFYFDGYYDFASSNNDFNPAITHGTANSPYGAHFIAICAAGTGGGDTNINITGTSITDGGVRVVGDSQNITLRDDGIAGQFNETSKKWLGQIIIQKISGADLQCNYGFAKYWDNNNNDFKVLGVDVSWLAGANDASADIKLLHHKATGWTYNAGSTPTPPTPIASMETDYSTESDIKNGENGVWKRDNLDVSIKGDDSEGTIFEIDTSANKAFELGNFIMRIRSQ